MLTSARRGIVYPNTDRSDSADVPRDIAALVAALEVDAIYGQGTLAARPTSSGGTPGIQGRFYFATDNTTLYYDFGTGWQAIGASSIPPDDSITGGALGAGVMIKQHTITHDNIVAGTIRGGNNEIAADSITDYDIDTTTIMRTGTYAARPAATTALNGVWYYATDQVALYLCVAAAWVRIGPQAGDIIWTAESAARTGYVLADGSAISRTGINADLFAKWGTTYGAGNGTTTFNVIDHQGRMPVAKGTHTDVSTLGNNDGSALASRRPKHKHTVGLTVIGGGSTNAGGSYGADTSSAGSSGFGFVSVTVGPQTGSEPTDTPAYLVLNPQIKL